MSSLDRLTAILGRMMTLKPQIYQYANHFKETFTHMKYIIIDHRFLYHQTEYLYPIREILLNSRCTEMIRWLGGTTPTSPLKTAYQT